MKLGKWLAVGSVVGVLALVVFWRTSQRPPFKLTTVRGPMLQSVTNSRAVVVMEFPRSQNVVVWLRGANEKSTRLLKRNAAFRHEVPLERLRSGTRYNYTVGSNGQKFSGSFLTAPKPSATSPLRFAAWGDSGDGEKGQFELAQEIEKYKPDFMLHTGDLIYPHGEPHDYDAKFFKPYQNLIKNAPFYGSLGNHDIRTQKGAPFLGNFVFPRNGPSGLEAERNYYFNWGNADFWVLDTNISYASMKNTLAPWVGSQLKRSKATWKVVVFHQPPYSSGLHGGWERTRTVLAPVLVENGADLVLSGHDHNYERFARQNKTTFIVTGAGGAHRYPRRRNEKGSVVWDNSAFSFSAFEISGKTLKARQVAVGGKVLDSWTIRK